MFFTLITLTAFHRCSSFLTEDFNKGSASTDTKGSSYKRPLVFHGQHHYPAMLHNLLQFAAQITSHAAPVQTSPRLPYVFETANLGCGKKDQVANFWDLHNLYSDSLNFPRIYS